MDVGLITQHNLRNFGSDLQAHSLYSYLNELGLQTYIINYWLEGLRHIYFSKYDWKVDSPLKFPRRILGNFARMLNSKNIDKSRKRFAQFRSSWKLTREYVGEGSIDSDPPIFDAYVAGSDAIWHPKYIVPARGLHFAKNLGKRTVSYAPSIGTSQISKAEAENMKRIISGIDFISCREKSGAERLSEILGRPVEAVLDPIFLHGIEWWKSLVPPSPAVKGDYIFTYLVLPDRKLARQTVKMLKKLYGLPVVSIALGIADNYGLGVDKTIFDAGPLEFLNLLINAKVVAASSFHGAAFGIHFRKDTYAIKSNPNDTRLDDLFKRFGLSSERIISAENPPAQSRIDYSLKDKLFEVELANSKKYLNNALKA